MAFFPIDEIKRKTFHLLCLLYILAYWFFPWRVVSWGFGILISLVIAGEAIRLTNPSFNKWILDVLGGVHRQEETGRLSGLLWTLSGSFLTMLIFPDKRIVVASLLFLAFGDASAALIGKKFGKHKILKQKSLEGSLACFCACLAVGLLFLNRPLAVAGAFTATFIELIPWPLNDNFWMPLVSSGILALISRFFIS